MLTANQKRFSKRKLIEHLRRRLDAIQAEHKFDPANGWAQVRGRGEEKNRAYGQYATLRGLLLDVEGGYL